MHLPRLHKRLTLVIGGLLLLVGLSGLGDNPYTVEQDQAGGLAKPPQQPAAESPSAATAITREITYEVKAGDNLASIFMQNGFSPTDLYNITQTAYGKQLREIFPGHRLSFTKLGNTLSTLTYNPDRLTSYTFTREDDRFDSEKEVFQPDRVTTYKHSSIDRSLFVASQRAGLPI